MSYEKYKPEYLYIKKWQYGVSWISILFLLISAAVIIGIILWTGAGIEKPPGTKDNTVSLIVTTIVYAGVTSTGQILVGLLLSICIYRISTVTSNLLNYKYGYWAKNAILLLCVTVYCLQPAVVVDIWTTQLPFSSRHFTTLVFGSIWQYAPFATIFIVEYIDRKEVRESWLLKVESSSYLARFRQLYFPKLAELIGILFSIRFVWMLTKFSLPYAFMGQGSPDYYPLSVQIGRTNQPSGYAYWGIRLWVLAVVILCLGYTLSYFYNDDKKISKPKKYLDFFLDTIVSNLIKVAESIFNKLGNPATRYLSIFASIVTLSLFLFPLVACASEYIFQLSSIGSVDIYSIYFTLFMSASVALLSSFVAVSIAYCSWRTSGSTLLWTVKRFPITVYTIPLVIFSVSVSVIKSDFVNWSTSNLDIYEIVAYVTPLTQIDAMKIEPLIPVVFLWVLSYITFCIPFCLLIMVRFFDESSSLREEQLSLADGLSGNLSSLQRIVVFPKYRSIVLYLCFFSLVIMWQDISFPSLVSGRDIPWLSYELKVMQDNQGVGYGAGIVLSLLVSFTLGLLYLIVSYISSRLRKL